MTSDDKAKLHPAIVLCQMAQKNSRIASDANKIKRAMDDLKMTETERFAWAYEFDWCDRCGTRYPAVNEQNYQAFWDECVLRGEKS